MFIVSDFSGGFFSDNDISSKSVNESLKNIFVCVRLWPSTGNKFKNNFLKTKHNFFFLFLPFYQSATYLQKNLGVCHHLLPKKRRVKGGTI